MFMCAHASGGRLAWLSARGGALPRGTRETQDPGKPHTAAVAATAEDCRQRKTAKKDDGASGPTPVLWLNVRR